MSLIRNALKPLAKSILIPLGLTVADTAIHKKMFESGTTTLIISNEEIKNILKIIKSLEESGLLAKGVSQAIKTDAKEQRGGFLGMFLGTLDVSLLGNLLTGNGVVATSQGRETNMPGRGTIIDVQGTITACHDF